MTATSARGLTSSTDLRSRTDLSSPFSELVSAPITVIGHTDRILTTPFERRPATAPVATGHTRAGRQTTPVGGPIWSSPTCMSPAVSDVGSAGRLHPTDKPGVKLRRRMSTQSGRRSIH